jgi:hypothetical protein
MRYTIGAATVSVLRYRAQQTVYRTKNYRTIQKDFKTQNPFKTCGIF